MLTAAKQVPLADRAAKLTDLATTRPAAPRTALYAPLSKDCAELAQRAVLARRLRTIVQDGGHARRVEDWLCAAVCHPNADVAAAAIRVPQALRREGAGWLQRALVGDVDEHNQLLILVAHLRAQRHARCCPGRSNMLDGPYSLRAMQQAVMQV